MEVDGQVAMNAHVLQQYDEMTEGMAADYEVILDFESCVLFYVTPRDELPPFHIWLGAAESPARRSLRVVR